jgi:hypothetical protein
MKQTIRMAVIFIDQNSPDVVLREETRPKEKSAGTNTSGDLLYKEDL